jgi:hypothetical protein
MLSVRMNEVAARSFGPAGLRDIVPPSELASGLRELVAQGVVLCGDLLVFTHQRADAEAAMARGVSEELSGWECSVSSLHLEDEVPLPADGGALRDDGELGFSAAEQVLMLRHGLGFAFEVVRLVRELPESVGVRCIVGANDSNGTFRFHRARAADIWMGPDLDGFELEQLVVVESGPYSFDGTPW